MSDAPVDNLPDSYDMPLDPPVVVKGVTYDVLHLQEPRAQQVRQAEQKLDANLSEASITDYYIALIQSVAKVPPVVVEALSVRQFGEAYGFLERFIADNPYGDIEQEDVPPDTFEMPLDPPLAWNGGEIHALTLREPTTGELRRARGFKRAGITPYSERTYGMELLTMVTGVNAAVIHGLRIRDYTRASRHLALFIIAGRRAGSRSPSS